jgi:transposase-like protein
MPKGVAKDPSTDKRRKVPQRAPKKGKLDTIKKLSDDNRSRYTAEERQRVCMDYLITGNASQTAKNFNMPYGTMVKWRKQDWWNDMLAEMTADLDIETRAKLNKIVGMAADKTLERLKKGNVILDKTGAERLIPVSARDAVMTLGVSYDKLRIADNKPTTIQGTSSAKQLEDLAEQFKKLAQGFEYKKVRQRDSIESTCEED